ncbi:uncharacterized protein EV420DRAFT_1622643 [Desarmillaria tabescens]|uniref:Aminoglycoside phosphotransferase domain-containing protein n=1 Tax=Armillaria tabescens TaxID=1929756 RepID=A0AA39JPX5_ARMTA|nr:uncharacterized protein EV420DRAFT_1622643 [Desarmillaria tabescens]KAK0445329.1 hypothetical protein EV420DRAFT_1622643 [Desarmillaria tabescens]
MATRTTDLIEDGVFSLPFNLVLKFSSRAREAEGVAMSLARSMGVPAPRFISYGEHSPNTRSREGSILMTRIPGKTLRNVIESLSPKELHTIMQEHSEILDRMRSYSNPWGARDIYGARVPGRHVSACDDEHNDEEGLAKLDKARRMPTLFLYDIDRGLGIEYWEYTSILRWSGLQVPWAMQLASLPGCKCSEELEYDLALIALSDSSFAV